MQQGKILASDLVGQTPDGPFLPASSVVQNSGSSPQIPNIQTSPQQPGSPIPSPIQQPANTHGFAGSPAPRTTSQPPLLRLVDSLIETKEVKQPSEAENSRLEKIYEYCIYAFMLCTLVSMLFMLLAAVVLENYFDIIFALGTSLCLTWFVIGVWGIRKTAELIKSNKVIISTDLPVGLTNIIFRILGCLAFATGLLCVGWVIYLAINTLGSEFDFGEKLARLWGFLPLFLSISAGCGFIGYFLWRPEATLSHLQSNSIFRTNDAASVSNEFLSTTIIMTKNLYTKLPYILLTLLGVSLVLFISFACTPMVYMVTLDGIDFSESFQISPPSTLFLMLIVYLSLLPLSLWLLSVAGILSVEISLAILACGRLAINKLQG